ncbi:MAG: succinate dehydrogenase iron-sulfur subunit [Bacteroidota bacterium]
MQATFRILRYNPEADSAPQYKDYTLTDLAPTDRVLDVLHRIKWEIDGTLTFRRSCAHGMCGSDGLKINGKNTLACSTLLQDLNMKKTVVIDPLPFLPIVKDLVVDMTDFFKKYELIKPYLLPKEGPPSDGKEYRQSPEDSELLMESTKCIMCACCSTSCPSLWSNERYLGPAAMLKAWRFIFDSRDGSGEERMNIVDSEDGVWRCHTIFNCVEACPKEINITDHLSSLKRRLVSR